MIACYLVEQCSALVSLLVHPAPMFRHIILPTERLVAFTTVECTRIDMLCLNMPHQHSFAREYAGIIASPPETLQMTARVPGL